MNSIEEPQIYIRCQYCQLFTRGSIDDKCQVIIHKLTIKVRQKHVLSSKSIPQSYLGAFQGGATQWTPPFLNACFG